MRLKGDIAGSNYLTNLSNILNIRGQRQNLALSKFQLEQAKREEERRGRSGRGAGTTTPTTTPPPTSGPPPPAFNYTGGGVSQR
jgi:hypothetical protein